MTSIDVISTERVSNCTSRSRISKTVGSMQNLAKKERSKTDPEGWQVWKMSVTIIMSVMCGAVVWMAHFQTHRDTDKHLSLPPPTHTSIFSFSRVSGTVRTARAHQMGVLATLYPLFTEIAHANTITKQC